MLRTFRMVAGVLMRISYALRPRCPALRAGQREFSVLRPFLSPFLFFGIGVHSIHRLNFPDSKVAAKARRPALNIIRFSAVGPDAFRTRLK